MLSPKLNYPTHQIQSDDINIKLSKVFTNYVEQVHQNSQRANSIFTNDVFSTIFRCLSILELYKTQNDSQLKHPDLQQ